jgi:hypothetical protein
MPHEKKPRMPAAFLGNGSPMNEPTRDHLF